MTWNYRVVKTALDDGESWLEISEVYYADNAPNASTEQAASVCGNSKEELLWTLDRMREAIEKPALVWDKSANKFQEAE